MKGHSQSWKGKDWHQQQPGASGHIVSIVRKQEAGRRKQETGNRKQTGIPNVSLQLSSTSDSLLPVGFHPKHSIAFQNRVISLGSTCSNTWASIWRYFIFKAQGPISCLLTRLYQKTTFYYLQHLAGHFYPLKVSKWNTEKQFPGKTEGRYSSYHKPQVAKHSKGPDS